VPADGLITPEANPFFCDLQHVGRRGHKMLFFSTKQRATEGEIRLTRSIEYRLAFVLHVIARRAYRRLRSR
jgi:hypothetical protein